MPSLPSGLYVTVSLLVVISSPVLSQVRLNKSALLPLIQNVGSPVCIDRVNESVCCIASPSDDVKSMLLASVVISPLAMLRDKPFSELSV